MTTHQENPSIFIVNASNNGIRIDLFLTKVINNITRAKVQYILNIGNVFKIDNKERVVINTPSYKVKENDKFEVILLEKSNNHLIAQNIPLDILYEDEYLAIINKPAGIIVHPGAGNKQDTLANALLYHYHNNLAKGYDITKIDTENTVNTMRPGIVHRLDKDTSGVLVIAKDDYTHSQLAKLFANHDIQRAYRCLVWGNLIPRHNKITTFITRNEKIRTKMKVSLTKGKKAVTNYKVLKYNENFSLVDINLETGRTHQIRLHMEYIKHPVVKDKTYGAGDKYYNRLKLPELKNSITNLNRHCLHAYKLGFQHPMTKEYILIEKEEPKELLDLYNLIWLPY